MELTIQDTKTLLTVSHAIFGYNFNEPLIHQVISSYIANSHQGTHVQKNRAQVSGSNKKPWKQKGTGRARAGSVKSPIWRSGGRTFTSSTKKHIHKINKKMYRNALKSIFSKLIHQNRLFVFEQFFISEPKTKLLIQKLNNTVSMSTLIITDIFNKNLFLAARNLYKVDVQHVSNFNPISLITFDQTFMTVLAVKKIEEILT